MEKKGEYPICKKDVSDLLHIVRDGEKITFCKGTHLVRYLIQQYGKKGAKKDKAKASKSEDVKQSSE